MSNIDTMRAVIYGGIHIVLPMLIAFVVLFVVVKLLLRRSERRGKKDT